MKHLTTKLFLLSVVFVLTGCNQAKESGHTSVAEAKANRATDRADVRSDELVDRGIDKAFDKLLGGLGL